MKGNLCFQIKSLDGLARFVGLGTLILCNNDLTWAELGKLRHMHILDLSLHGNSQLEKEPYCESHSCTTYIGPRHFSHKYLQKETSTKPNNK